MLKIIFILIKLIFQKSMLLIEKYKYTFIKNNKLDIASEKKLLNHFIENKVDLFLYKKNCFKKQYNFLFNNNNLENLLKNTTDTNGNILLSGNIGAFFIGIEFLKYNNLRVFDSYISSEKFNFQFTGKKNDEKIYEKTEIYCNYLNKGYSIPFLFDDFNDISSCSLSPFLNKDVWVPTYPFYLAAFSNCKIIPVFFIRTSSSSFDVYIEDEVTNIKSFLNIAENFVLKYPDQWINQFLLESNTTSFELINKHLLKSMKNLERYVFSLACLKGSEGELNSKFQQVSLLYKKGTTMISKGFDNNLQKDMTNLIKEIVDYKKS